MPLTGAMATELKTRIDKQRQPPYNDAFSEAASKLEALLDLPAEPRMLLIGGSGTTQLGRLAAGFPDREVHESIRGLVTVPVSGEESFDLILWSFDPEREGSLLDRGLARLRELLAPRGSLLLLAPNRLALRRLRRRPAQLFRRGARTSGAYQAAARRNGFTRVEEFLPMPGMSLPEEMAAAHLPVEVPAHAPATLHRLGRLGLLGQLHDGYLYHLAVDTSGTERMLERLAGPIEERTGRHPALRLDRYALRGRGALILSLTDTAATRPLIARITTSEEVDQVVRRNSEWTSWLHASPALEESAKALIPEPIASLTLGSLNAHIEVRVPGVIAWKAAGGETDSALFDGACAFLRSLARATVEPITLDTAVLDRDLTVPQHPWYDAEFIALLSAYRSRLTALMEGRTRSYCLTHGDYGYGNLLARGEPARVSGVIDWDQARMDLAGIDLVNFLVQRHRQRSHSSVLEALQAVRGELPAGESGTVVRAVYPEVPGMREPDRRIELFCWFLWRFIERDTRYRPEFDRGRDSAVECLRWALEEIFP